MAKIQVKKSADYGSSLDEWYRKNEVLNDLLDDYDVLTKKDKKKVQAIYEYLVFYFDLKLIITDLLR